MLKNTKDADPEFADLKLQAKKLAVLLYDSTFPEEIKEAWIALLPKMELVQIDNFLNMLETKFLNERTKDIDALFADQLEAIKEEHAAAQLGLEFKIAKEIEKLSDSINKLS